MKTAVRILFSFIIMSIVFVMPQHALAEVSVYINQEKINFEDTAPFIDKESNRTLVPFRKIFESLGSTVSYDGNTKTVMGINEDVSIKLPLNQRKAYKNNAVIELDVAAKVVDGRTMVPLRFIAESLGCNVFAQKRQYGLAIHITPLKPISEKRLDDDLRKLKEVKVNPGSNSFLTLLEVVKGSVQAFELNNPKRLVIDLEDTINQLDDKYTFKHELVSSIRTSEHDDSTTRVVFDISPETDTKIDQYENKLLVTLSKKTISDESKDSESESESDTKEDEEDKEEYSSEWKLPLESEPILIVPSERELNIESNLIIIDPGHGGEENGATSILGNYERIINLSIALQLKDRLEDEGYEVLMTREGDTTISLKDRVIMANNTNAFAFISIHANYSGRPSAKGLEVFTMYNTDHTLANYVQYSILPRTGQVDRKVKEAGFVVIKYTKMPAILVETGFLSNIDEERWLWQGENQKKIVEGIVAGIEKYKGSIKNK
ncbi:MAG: AMIN domain-containing protein [Firmicutes bacterium]|nr:AMIN domain-containing protein [Bacillota bacterium]